VFKARCGEDRTAGQGRTEHSVCFRPTATVQRRRQKRSFDGVRDRSDRSRTGSHSFIARRHAWLAADARFADRCPLSAKAICTQSLFGEQMFLMMQAGTTHTGGEPWRATSKVSRQSSRPMRWSPRCTSAAMAALASRECRARCAAKMTRSPSVHTHPDRGADERPGTTLPYRSS
jgi:hypothetical protein